MFKVLQNIFQYLKSSIIGRQDCTNNDHYPVNYQGHNQYDRIWLVGINKDNKMQLWAITYKDLIRNCGYYEPYRNITILNKIINWKL